ncbi:MAG: hypothetical protein E7157_02215 [Lactobacillales bacterium]|nr:hypothetical protein [Lactobacillales bacterium]
MNEKTRQRVLNNKKECENTITRKQEILKEISELTEELKKCEIVNKLKELGTEYLYEEKLQQKLEEQQVSELQRIKDVCTHPILVITGYKKHKNNRVINAKTKEEAEYASVRCLECGKVTYTKDKDDNEDWNSFILKPTSVGQLDADYVKRITFELPLNVKFKDLYNYYQEIMLDSPQKETIIKVLEKVKEK